MVMAWLFRHRETAEAPVLPIEDQISRPLWKSAVVLAAMVALVGAVNWSVSGRLSFALACCPKPVPKLIESGSTNLSRLGGRLFYELEAGETNPYPEQALYHGHVEIRRGDILSESGEFLTLRTASGVETRIAKDRVHWVEPWTSRR